MLNIKKIMWTNEDFFPDYIRNLQATVGRTFQMCKEKKSRLFMTSKASISSCLGQQSCHRHGSKTALAQRAEITKCHVIFIVFFKFWIKDAGGEDFNQFLKVIPSFWFIICLCSWIRSYLSPKSIGGST